MKRAWRFVKWTVGTMGWFEVYMISTLSAMLIGAWASPGLVRNIAWGTACAIVASAVLYLVVLGCKNMWKQFLMHDEQVFDILKKEKLDEQ